MEIPLPHTITNVIGETLIFHRLESHPEGDKLIVENFVEPGIGPVMHTHWQQDEALTVVKGTIGYQLLNGPEQFAGEGETVLFKRGVPHRFWNAGAGILHCKGFIQPAHSVVFFLSSLFAAQNKTGSARPEPFDGAYLISRYASEYDLPELPSFVKKLVLPATYRIGKLLGKYKHFENAPVPLKKVIVQ